MLTDHVDRNPDKCLLRGRIGWIVSWEVADEERSEATGPRRQLEKIPKVVYVKFKEEVQGELVTPEWQVGNLDKGVYPIVAKSADWFLDKGRRHPMLSVRRTQLPLAPAFAVTSHASQGQTLRAAIVDSQLPKGTSVIASYVPLTRVKRREDLFVFRPFERTPFMQGNLAGLSLIHI